MTWVLREWKTDGGRENPTPPLGPTDRQTQDMCTESYTLTKVFRATNTPPGEISSTQIPIL